MQVGLVGELVEADPAFPLRRLAGGERGGGARADRAGRAEQDEDRLHAAGEDAVDDRVDLRLVPGGESKRTSFAPIAWIWSSSNFWSAALRFRILYPVAMPNRGMLPNDGAGGGLAAFETVTDDDAVTVSPPVPYAVTASVCCPFLSDVVSRRPAGSPPNWYGAT